MVASCYVQLGGFFLVECTARVTFTISCKRVIIFKHPVLCNQPSSLEACCSCEIGHMTHVAHEL